MNKILLVYEDYADLMNVEASLKKIGFDVLGVTNEYSLSEQVLSFNPEVVVANGRVGGKVASLGVGKRLKEMSRWPGKVVLIFPANGKPTTQDLTKIRTDLMLEAPVPPLRLIQVLAKLLGHDEAQLLERLNKIIHSENAGPAGSFTLNSGKGVASSGNDRFFVGGGAGFGAEGTGPGGKENDIFRIHGENEEGAGSADVSGGAEEDGLFARLKNAKDLYSEENPTVAGAEKEELFPDVDMQALEAELEGKKPVTGAEAAEEKPVSFDLRQKDSETEAQLALREELKKAQDSVSERVAKYSKLTESVQLAPLSTVRRVETRRRQRDLTKEWDPEKIKDLDELRREFTKALFKK
jgi:hypothetical protein